MSNWVYAALGVVAALLWTIGGTLVWMTVARLRGQMMTADYSQMPPGREMDALVAEKVMGCRVGRWPHGGYRCGCGVTMAYPHAGDTRDDQLHGDLAAYSTDIEAAWRVVERLTGHAGEDADIAVYALSDGTYDCRIGERDPGGDWGGDEVHADAETAPLAISRAALIATESEPKE